VPADRAQLEARLRALSERLDALEGEVGPLRLERDRLVRELRRLGVSYRAISEATGGTISLQRAFQIAEREPP
jgi:hypothetical protein